MAMALVREDTLAGTRDMLLPALHEAVAQMGIRDLRADLHVDYVYDRITLGVSRPIIDRMDIDRGDHRRLFWPRLQQALGIKTETAKAVRAERRQLIVRGQAARMAKPRRV